MLSRIGRGVPLLAVAVAVVVLSAGCAPDSESKGFSSPSPSTSATSDTELSGYRKAVESFDRDLPAGYEFPDGLTGAETAGKWWWCATIESAWHACFVRENEAEAISYLKSAEAFDPGEYVGFEGPNEVSIDREVRYIGGGVDSLYVEYTSTACNEWARSLGRELGAVN